MKRIRLTILMISLVGVAGMLLWPPLVAFSAYYSNGEALSTEVPSKKGNAPDHCLTCHNEIGDKNATLFKADIHYTKGISCAGCHGGDPTKADMEQAMDTAAGYHGVPKGDDISRACATCHSNAETMKSFGSTLPTNQWKMLQASVHGGLSVSGKEHIAQCISCHGTHGIVPVKHPSSPVYPLNVIATCSKCHSSAGFMKVYNAALPVDQVEKYRTSVHGARNAKGDAKAAECASCHGSHDIRAPKDAKSSVYPTNVPMTCAKCHADAGYMTGHNIPTNQYDEYSKSVHGVALLQKGDVAAPACNDCHGNHGAAPPGVETVSMVCGSCHALNAELFSSSPHKKAFDKLQLPECETCHGHHEIVAATDALLGVASDAVCSRCHEPSDTSNGYRIAAMMRNLTDSLNTGTAHAAAILQDGEQKGMEVSEAKFKLRDVHQARFQARTVVHSFNENKFRDVVSGGIKTATAVAAEGQHAIDEYYFRRWGLGVATLIISIVAVSLHVTIRRIEARQKGPIDSTKSTL